MPYITSIERLARQEGVLEGRQEGRLEERQEIVRSLLSSRFDGIDEVLETVIERLMQMPATEFGSTLPALSSLTREEILNRFGRYRTH